jgi:hypothetical protein
MALGSWSARQAEWPIRIMNRALITVYRSYPHLGTR